MLSSEADSLPAGTEDGAVIAVVGVNHLDTPIAIREKLSIPVDALTGVLSSIRSIDGVREAAALSTCNRVELYTVLDPAREELAERTASELCEAMGVPFEGVQPSLYVLQGLEAVRHLFEVASGLDSMVPGENEIFSQLKSAYLAAVDAGTAGPELSRLCQRALR